MGASQSTIQKPVSLSYEGLVKNADSLTTPWPTEFDALEWNHTALREFSRKKF